jgi:hypothetical protein
MENHTLTVDGDVGEGGFGMPPYHEKEPRHEKNTSRQTTRSRVRTGSARSMRVMRNNTLNNGPIKFDFSGPCCGPETPNDTVAK